MNRAGVSTDDEAQMAAVLAELAALAGHPGRKLPPDPPDTPDRADAARIDDASSVGYPAAPATRASLLPDASPHASNHASTKASWPGSRRVPRTRSAPDLAPRGRTAAPAPTPRPGFRPDVEGLRAVAIVLVVAYHAGLRWVPGGFVGVDVFFVISGFLITGQLVREVAGTGRLSVARFYGRRVLRLLPAASLVIGVTLVAGWWWLPATRLRGLATDAIAANVYAINYRLAWLGTDYRGAASAPSPLQHFWSLAVEEQFYLVIPVLLLVTAVLVRNRAAFVVVLAGITAGSLWWSVTSSAGSSVWAYFGAPARVWELGAGALLALAAPVLAERSPSVPPLPVPVLRWGGLLAVALAAARFGEKTVFPGWAAMLPVAGAAAVLAAGCLDPDGGARTGLGLPVMRAIGARSYSWYLWHWPVLLIAPFVLDRHLGPVAVAVAVAVSFGLAAITYELLERPLRDNEVLRAQPLKAGALGLALTAVVVALALLAPLLPARISGGTQTAAAVKLTGQGTARSRAFGKQLKAAETVTRLPANLSPSLKDAVDDDPRVARDGCLVSFAGTSTPRHCESYGAAGAARTVVLFGDSHAAQWFPAMESIAKKRHWRLAVFTKVVCSGAAVKIYLDPKKGGYDECVRWRARSIARIHALQPALVVTTSLADHGDIVGVTGDVDDAWAKAWTASIIKIRNARTRVVYLTDTPAPRTDVPECLSLHPRAVSRCVAARSTATQTAQRAATTQAAAKAGATVVDTAPWFCGRRRCPVVVGNTLVYRDASHITTDYIRLLAPLLSERLSTPKRG